VPTGGVGNPWGLSVAPDGSIWGAYVNWGVVKIAADSDGSVAPTRAWTLGRPFRILEDDNGYLYVSQLENRKVLVFAPGAGAGSSPIRTLDVWARGLVMDINGDLVTASDGYLRVFEPGASTNNFPIKQININGNANDIGIDSEKRIWVTAEGKVKVYNPELQNQSVPVLQSTADWANKLNNPENIAVSQTTPGLFAVSTYNNGVRTYDWSTILPAVPPASEPSIDSARIDGDYRIAGTLTATPGVLTGYPDGVLTYKWQTRDSVSGTWSDIAGVTDATYEPVLGDTYKYLRVAITITNSEGSDTAYSAGTTKLGHGYVRTPSAYIGGSQTKLTTDPWTLRRLDNGNILVANRFGNVSEFAAGASFNAAPIREISVAGYQNPSGLSVNEDGTIWISYEGSKVVKVAADAGLNATPLQTIDPTGSCRVGSVVQDSNGFIYAPCWYLSEVLVFAGDADVNSAPVRRIPTLPYGFSVRIDPAGNIAFPGNGGYRTFAPGGAGTSNDPIISKDMNTHVRDVTWDDQGNAIFAVSDGFWIYRADFSDYVNSGAPATRVYNDGWSNFGNYGASVEFDPVNDQIISPRQGGTPQINFWDLSLVIEGDPVQPGAPVNVRVAESDASLTVTWEAPTGSVDEYTVRVTGGEEPFTCTTNLLTCSFDDRDGVENGVTYTVIVASHKSWLSTDAGGVSAIANPSAPQAVTNVQTSIGDRTFTITWDAATGEVTNYVVTATSGSASFVCTTSSTSCTFGQLDGVTNFVDYSVTIKTVRRSVFAITEAITVSPGLPGKVTGVTATGLNEEIVVNWTVPVGIITSYTATAAIGNLTYSCDQEDPTATSCTISGVTNGSTYSVTVVARRGELEGPSSDAVQTSVNQAPIISDFSVQGTVQSGRTLRVTDLSVVGSPTPTVTYQWQSAADEEGPWLDLPDADGLTFELTKPDVGRYFRFMVTASNGIGESDNQMSEVLGPVLNLSGSTENTARAITGLRGVATNGKVKLSWDAVKGITADSYTITVTGGGPRKVLTVNGVTLTSVVKGLKNGTTYSFSVVATGYNESKSKTITVMPIDFLGKVGRVSAVVKATTLTLRWVRPVGTSPVAAYRIVLKSLTKGAPDVEVASNTATVTIAKLVKGATYRLSITGRNSLGLGSVYSYPKVINVAK
jgi:sugar lactone lactonase YvrE